MGAGQLTDYDDSHLSYGYDATGKITQQDDYHANTTVYAYTDTGRLSTVTAPGSKTWDYDLNALGQPTKVSAPNGIETHYSFDNRNRMTKIEHKDGASVVDGWEYALADDGAITQITASDDSYWAHEYDGRGRLTKAERYDDDGSTLLHRYSYVYDDGDNMLTKQVHDATTTTTTTTTMTYNDANELTAQSSAGTTTAFAYDAWGRMTSRADGTYTASYVYRYAGKLRSVTSNFPGEGTVSYDYGGDGKRRERTSGGVTTRYNWDSGARVINEENNAGTLTRTYIGHMVAHVDGASPSAAAYEYYFHDHLGSTRRLRAQDKSSLGAYEYTPYGEVYSESGDTSITRRFATLDRDDVGGLYYAPFRYYIAATASWLQKDPLGMVAGPNLFAYSDRAPVHLFDPLGLCPSAPMSGPAVAIMCPFGSPPRDGIFWDWFVFMYQSAFNAIGAVPTSSFMGTVTVGLAGIITNVSYLMMDPNVPTAVATAIKWQDLVDLHYDELDAATHTERQGIWKEQELCNRLRNDLGSLVMFLQRPAE